MAKKKEMTLEEKLNEAIVKDVPYEVPRNWVWTYIGSIFDITSSKRVFKDEWKSEGIPFYRAREIAALSEKGIVNNELFITEDMYNEYKKKYGMPVENDIMISGVGTLGKAYIVSKGDKFYFKDGNILWFKNKGKVNAKYIFYLYKSLFMINQIYRASAGTTVDTYTIINAKRTTFPLPPLKEQQRIVDRIESLFEKLDRAEELIEEARDGFEKRKASILEKVLNNNLYRKISLKECIKFINEKKAPEDDDVYIGLENIRKGFGIVNYNIAKNVKSTKTKFKEGDVLYGRLRPYLNKHDVVDRDGICSTDIIVMRPKKQYDSRYINYILDTLEFIRYANENSSGINLPRVSSKVIGEYLIPDIELYKQVEIINVFKSLFEKEKNLEELTQLEEQIELIKKSILAKAFRGELGTNCKEDVNAVELLKEILSKN